MQDHSSHDRINPVKGAIMFSNILTTLSPTYAQEVRTAEFFLGDYRPLIQDTQGNVVDQEDCFYDLPYNTGYQISVLRLQKTRDEIMKCTLSIYVDIYFD